MSLKDTWKPRVDGVDDADSSAVNEIAEAVIQNEKDIETLQEQVDNLSGGGGGANTQRVEINNSNATIEPNKFYIFPEMTNLDITLGDELNSEIVQEYKFRFISGATATTLILPETIKGNITVSANSVVEISIIDNYAVSQSWAVQE